MAHSLRPMEAADHAAVARIWHEGWHDAHAGLVPDALTAIRGPEAFAAAVPTLTRTIWVGLIEGAPSGFVAWQEAGIDFLFLERKARGTGLAAALMARAEALMAADGVTEAELDYVKGNARAAQFYARQGWRILREEQDRTEIDGQDTAPWTSVICGKRLAVPGGD